MNKKRRLSDKKEDQLQYEKLRDTQDRFVAERYDSDGFYNHFHMNPELYCVLHGEVIVTVDGDSRTLLNGEMVLICGLKSHSYTVKDKADIAYFHIGTLYIEPFRKIYGKIPSVSWLVDKDYNMKVIYPIVNKVIEHGSSMSELEKVSYANLLLANIIKRYSMNEAKSNFVPKQQEDKISEIIQYIYEHSDEELSLDTLSKKFSFNPQALSRKLSKYIKTDLRVFINDVRAQKVMQMVNDDRYSYLSFMEIVTNCGFNSVSTFYRSYHRNFKNGELKKSTNR